MRHDVSVPPRIRSLVHDAWLPVIAASGAAWLVRPADIVGSADSDPIADLAWPRADFRIAGRELLIGLLATICPPEDDDAWREWWDRPPAADALHARFAPYADAFVLDGDGSRFLQDSEDFAGESLPIERLLIDAPGENTLKKNTDLMVKRGRVPLMSRASAAIALYTLQAFAPSGGAGHRTSLRGGGPLVTMVLPPADAAHPRTLWHQLWANVPNGRAPTRDEWPLVFPWLAPTRTSDPAARGRPTALGSEHAHRLQAFWGMPRRIRLDLHASAPGEVCGLTGRADPVMVTGFRTRPWGIQYVQSAHLHPLTPTYRTKPAEPPLSVHPQPDGIGYRHWVGLVEADGQRSEPAAAVRTFHGRKPLRRGESWLEARLLVAGFDMDNMKARGLIEGEMPLFVTARDEDRRALHALAACLAKGATEVAGLLRFQLRNALQIDETDRTTVEAVRARFFELTAPSFWSLLRGAAPNAVADADDLPLRARWLEGLRPVALDLFDAAAPLDPLDARAVCGRDGKPPPIVAARQSLTLALRGYSKAGTALFTALALPLPVSAKMKGRRNAG